MGVIAFIIAAIFIYFLVVEFWLDILLLAIIIGIILVIVTIITKKVELTSDIEPRCTLSGSTLECTLVLNKTYHHAFIKDASYFGVFGDLLTCIFNEQYQQYGFYMNLTPRKRENYNP